MKISKPISTVSLFAIVLFFPFCDAPGMIGPGMEGPGMEGPGMIGPGMEGTDWKVFNGRGYSIRHPSGWSVTETSDNRILIESTQGRYTLTSVMLPNVRPDNLSPHMVQTCTGTRIDIRSFQRVNPFSMQASADRGDTYETSAIMYQPAQNGITLMCATIVASKADFDAFAETAAKVVESMIPAAPQQESTAAAVQKTVSDWNTVPMVPKRDPEEGSFTVNIPRGWSFQGGTGRAHILETRQWYISSSPDGEITIIYGDVDVPRFMESDPMGMVSQGQWYNTDFSGSYFVWPYQHGLAFARQRAETLFSSYSGFKIDKENQLDLTDQIRQEYRQYIPDVQNLTSGISSFTFTHNGKKFSGAYWATTIRFPEYASWAMINSMRIIAAAGREEEALNLAMKMIPSMDPQWEQQQNAGAMRNQQIMTQSFAETNRIMRESYESRVASSERGTRDFIDGIWGTQRLQDPSTGRRYEMQHGSLSYWLHNDATVVGTDSYSNPHPSHFRQLLRVRN